MSSSIRNHTRYTEETFSGVRLEHAGVTSCEFQGCTFVDCSFRETIFRGCRFVNCRFADSDLSLVQVPNSAFVNVRFADTRLVGINWTEAHWSTARLWDPLRFERCNLSHATFIGLHLSGLKVLDCLAHDVDFREADLSKADFRGADLAESLFGNTNLTGADLSRARNYAISPARNSLAGAKFSLPEAMALLYNLDIVLTEDAG